MIISNMHDIDDKCCGEKIISSSARTPLRPELSGSRGERRGGGICQSDWTNEQVSLSAGICGGKTCREDRQQSNCWSLKLVLLSPRFPSLGAVAHHGLFQLLPSSPVVLAGLGSAG